MHKLLLIFIFCFTIGGINAQPPGYTVAPDVAAFSKELSASAASINSLKSSFHQEKNLSLLEDKVTSSGIFLFKKEHMLRMEYKEPFSYLLIINNDKITIRDRQKTSSYSAGSNKIFTSINRIMEDCLRGTVLDNKDFKSTIYIGKDYNLIELIPVNKEMKTLFTKLEVFLNKENFTVEKLNMVEVTGDNTLIIFSSKEYNKPISDSEFSVK